MKRRAAILAVAMSLMAPLPATGGSHEQPSDRPVEADNGKGDSSSVAPSTPPAPQVAVS